MNHMAKPSDRRLTLSGPLSGEELVVVITQQASLWGVKPEDLKISFGENGLEMSVMTGNSGTYAVHHREPVDRAGELRKQIQAAIKDRNVPKAKELWSELRVLLARKEA